MSLRIVFDTNIRVSALIFHGMPLEVTGRAIPPRFQQIVSAALLEELEAILTDRFRWRASSAALEISRIQQAAVMTNPVDRITVCRDPDDNRVLECAVSGQAHMIVTGDKDLLSLGSYNQIQILTLRQFLDANNL